MQLNAEIRKSFQTGKFEEFLDRAEDHLREKLAPQLPRLSNAPSQAWRSVIRDSYEITKTLNRPSEQLTIMIAKARIPMGYGVFTDYRFPNWSRAVTKLAKQTSIDVDPIEDLITRSQPFWREDRLETRRKGFQSLFYRFEQHRSVDELVTYLSAEKQTLGLYDEKSIRDQFTANMKNAKELNISGDLDLFRYMVLVDCYGPLFHRDPFYPELNDPFGSKERTQTTLEIVAKSSHPMRSGEHYGV